jgi:myo-inositol-1(or 4)-monophosphatase
VSRHELSLAEYERIALDVAHECAQLLLRGYRSRPTPTEKARADLVTEFDLQSEHHLHSRLLALTPDVGWIGEEASGRERAAGAMASAGLCWYCDPLDGTTNYVHGHPFWGVSVGLMQGSAPLAGAVVAPALNLTWSGHRGGGARRNGETCQVSRNAELAHALVATGFPPDREHAPANNFDAFMRVKRQVRGVRRCGSAAIDMCLVADGTYDAYWERRLNAWDLAAGAAILLEAGGLLSALDGSAPKLARGHVLASNGQIHSALVPLVT